MKINYKYLTFEVLILILILGLPLLLMYQSIGKKGPTIDEQNTYIPIVENLIQGNKY